MRTGYASEQAGMKYMVRIYRFTGVRPDRCAAPAIAAVPYDVVTADEARAIIAKNPETFLRVSRPDAELPGLAPNDDRVYQRAHENFNGTRIADGRMKKDPYLPCISTGFARMVKHFWGSAVVLMSTTTGETASAGMNRHGMTRRRTGPGILRQSGHTMVR